MRPPGACVVFTAVLLAAIASPLTAPAFAAASAGAQDDKDWENKVVEDILQVGFLRQNRQQALDIAGLRKGMKLTREARDLAIKELFKTNKYEHVNVDPQPLPGDANKIVVTLRVTEYVVVERVEFKGINEIPLN